MRSLIFILSPPRSGSTLLQRLLSSHEAISSFSEVSMLLRLLGGPDEVVRFADFCELNVELAKGDIRMAWPEFDCSYRAEVKVMMERIYSQLAEGHTHFIDKTPRYTLIAEEIYKTFPEAKFIVLWRHPLAVAASVSKTFARDTWDLGDFKIDLTRGLDRLHAFDTPGRARVISLRYEDLVEDPTPHMKALGDFLEIPDLAAVLDKPLNPNIRGRLGDPSGVKKYSHISPESSQTWHIAYDTYYRQRWARNYFDDPRSGWLARRGYELPESFHRQPLLKNLSHSLKESLRVYRKERKRLKQAMHIFRSYHINGSSASNSENQ